MISSVSGVSFKGAATTAYDPISRPGKYTIMPKEKPEGKSSHKALKVIGGLVATALVAGTLLVVGKNRNWFKVLDNAEAVKNAPFMEKCKHYLGKAANFVDEKCWTPIKELPSKISEWWKNRGASTEQAATEATEAAS